MPDEQPRRAVGYVRVSSVGGRSGPGYHTLDIQRASIQRTAAFRQYEIVDVLVDEDETGKSRDRPQFKVAMERVLAGDADAIVVWKVSRFSRNWAEAAADVERLLENGKDLLSEEGFDTATAGGRLLLRILFSLANWEHDVLGEHWEVIKAKAVRDRGSHLGKPPLGYRKIIGGGGKLEPDPETAPMVVSLFDARAAGASWAQLADRLDELRPRPQGRRDRKDVERIITNRVYLGETRWRDEVNETAHDPLVTVDVWERANAAAANDAPRRAPRSKRREFPLTNWLRCGSCGGPMSGSVEQHRGQPYALYKCGRRRGGCAKPQNINCAVCEEWALTQAAEMHAKRRFAATETDGRLARLLAERDEIEKALHELGSIEARRDLGEDWLPMIRQLRTQKTDVAKQIPAAARAAGATARQEDWDDLTAAEQWQALRDMAPLGAVVGDRVWPPVDRLAFIVNDGEANTVPER